MKRILAFAVVLMLGACGSASDNVVLDSAKALKDSTLTRKPSVATQRAAVVQAVRGSGKSDPVLMIELPERKAVASLVVGARSGGYVSWYDATGVSVTMRNGVVTSTRGLGFDLMASDMRGTLSAINGRTSSYGRLHRYLDGEGTLQSFSYSCSARRNGNRVTEHCTSADESFANTYELNGGSVVRSRQWIGAGIGYADLTRLQ